MNALTPEQCKEISVAKAGRGQCEGSCKDTHGGHFGKCHAVIVTAPDGYNWGWWAYCEHAVQEDRSRNFTVNILGDKSFENP